MRCYIFKSLLLAVSFLSVNVGYSQSWISIGNSNLEKCFTESSIESSATTYKLKITINGFYDSVISSNGMQYHRIYFDEGSFLSNIGEPQLPTITRRIAIPIGTTHEAKITEIDWEEVKIGKIYPAQKQCLESEPEPDFSMKESVYNRHLYPQPIIIEGQEQSWRNIRNVSIDICPFKYYPTENKIAVLKEFVLEVNFTNNSDDWALESSSLFKAVKWGMFNNLTDSRMSELRFGEHKIADRNSDDYDYLVIVGNINEILTEAETLQRFLKWKAFKGYRTKMVTTMETGTGQDSIKNYIAQEYANHHIQYVLFIGDHDKIPTAHVMTPMSRYVESDYWYGCLDGANDYEAEVPIGRMSTNDLYYFRNVVNKTIDYESRYQGNYKKTLLVANYEGAPSKYQGCCESIRTETYTVPLQFTTAYGASISNGGNEATNAQVKNYVNNGMHIVNYRGHGDYDRWWNWNVLYEHFTNTDVDDIDTCSIYFNICCQNGRICNEPCMMEKMTRLEKAAVACLAATEDSYTYANHEFDRKLFTKLLNDGVWYFGDLDVQAHIATFTPELYNYARDNAYVYLCGGDPTLEIWTGDPKCFGNVEIEKNNSDISISTTCSDFTVSVVSDNGMLIEKYTSSGISCVLTPPSGSYYITLNKHNYYPYIIYCSDSGFIQDESIEGVSFYSNTPIDIGYDVTTTKPYGNVKVKRGASLIVQNGNGSVTIKNGFECEKGAEFVVK